ncbi:MAG: prepilin-type N-terminal cleavage/methylation domain-containing protein [Clostridia bacterium]|nr:prepilin-type N-terminal cleavage/methylation domain-containing protein [Clostridia bacterium]
MEKKKCQGQYIPKNGFTLVELLISLVVLAILAVGVLRLFMSAQVQHLKASDLDHAVLESTTFAEEVRHLRNAPEEERRIVIYFDKQWGRRKEKSEDTPYVLYADIIPVPQSDGGLMALHVRVTRLTGYPFEKKGEAEIYKLSSIFESESYWGERP